MSRAFVNEDASGPEPRYHLPRRDDPAYGAAAAWALLEGANMGDSLSAEEATGYAWGEQKLRPHVERFLAEAKPSPGFSPGLRAETQDADWCGTNAADAVCYPASSRNRSTSRTIAHVSRSQ